MTIQRNAHLDPGIFMPTWTNGTDTFSGLPAGIYFPKAYNEKLPVAWKTGDLKMYIYYVKGIFSKSYFLIDFYYNFRAIMTSLLVDIPLAVMPNTLALCFLLLLFTTIHPRKIVTLRNPCSESFKIFLQFLKLKFEEG